MELVLAILVFAAAYGVFRVVWRRPSAEPKDPDRELLAGGIIAAMLAPPIGFFLAIALLIRSRVGPGLGVMALCLVGIPISIVFWGAVFAA